VIHVLIAELNHVRLDYIGLWFVIVTTEDEANSSETDSSIQPSAKKKKVTSVGVTRRKNTFEELVDKIETAGTLREENRERRHQETLQTRNNAVEVFASKMDALLKKT
jgi:hypothetical protein